MTTPRNTVQSHDGHRAYVWPPTGETFTSVTTILNVLSKPHLPKWAAKMAAEYAVAQSERIEFSLLPAHERVEKIKSAHTTYMDNAGAIGDHVHHWVECDIKKTHEAISPEPPHFKFWQAWKLVNEPEFMFCEETVYNRSEGYAGSFDFIARINGVPTIIDIKTGKNVYPEVALQLAAYSRGEFIGSPDGSEIPMPEVQAAGVLHLRMTGYKYFPVRIDDDVWQAFRYVKEAYRWQRQLSKTVFNQNGDKNDEW